jgi:hypothetical protein
MINTSTTGQIKFYYKKDVLFNDVSLMSNYMCKNMATKDGNSLTDEYAISDDERDLVDVALRSILPDIYEAMTKITNSVNGAFDDDEVISTDHCVSFTIQDNSAYNDNVLTIVDASLYNCLKYGTLKEVYATIVNPDFFKISAERFVAELFKLKQRLFQLKKKSVVSNLT